MGPVGGRTAEPLANAFSREGREAPHLLPRGSTGTTGTRVPLMCGAQTAHTRPANLRNLPPPLAYVSPSQGGGGPSDDVT